MGKSKGNEKSKEEEEEGKNNPLKRTIISPAVNLFWRRVNHFILLNLLVQVVFQGLKVRFLELREKMNKPGGIYSFQFRSKSLLFRFIKLGEFFLKSLS